MSFSTIGIIGIGAMGGGIAANLLRKKYSVRFFARAGRSGHIDRLLAAGAQRAETPAELAKASDAIILCLPDSPAVEGILDRNAGLVPSLRPGTIIVDCSTSHPDSTRRLAAALARDNVFLLDGPLTGSRTQAEAGTVNVLGAGPRAAFDAITPVLQSFAANVFHLGESGAGHAAKLLNNFFGQLALAGLCETWGLIQTYGIDPAAFQRAITVSGGNSATFQGAFPALLNQNFELNFAQRLAAKDVRYLVEIATGAGLAAPLASELLAVHLGATAAGFGDRDVKTLLLAYQQAQKQRSPSPVQPHAKP